VVRSLFNSNFSISGVSASNLDARRLVKIPRQVDLSSSSNLTAKKNEAARHKSAMTKTRLFVRCLAACSPQCSYSVMLHNVATRGVCVCVSRPTIPSNTWQDRSRRNIHADIHTYVHVLALVVIAIRHPEAGCTRDVKTTGILSTLLFSAAFM